MLITVMITLRWVDKMSRNGVRMPDLNIADEQNGTLWEYPFFHVVQIQGESRPEKLLKAWFSFSLGHPAVLHSFSLLSIFLWCIFKSSFSRSLTDWIKHSCELIKHLWLALFPLLLGYLRGERLWCCPTYTMRLRERGSEKKRCSEGVTRAAGNIKRQLGARCGQQQPCALSKSLEDGGS